MTTGIIAMDEFARMLNRPFKHSSNCLVFFFIKESELQDLTDQLELRSKELKSQEAMLQTKVFHHILNVLYY